MLDGVHRCGADSVPDFIEAAAPTADELHALLQMVMHYEPQVVDHGLALADLTLRLLAGNRYALRGVLLTARQAGSTRAHAQFFSAPIHDSQPFGARHFSPAMPNVPVAAARPTPLRIAADCL